MCKLLSFARLLVELLLCDMNLKFQLKLLSPKNFKSYLAELLKDTYLLLEEIATKSKFCLHL